MTTLLEDLKTDQAIFTDLLNHYEKKPLDGLTIGVRMTMDIYRQILTDGLRVLNSLIEFMERK